MINPLHARMQEAVAAARIVLDLQRERDAYREALRLITQAQPGIVAVLRKHGVVFDGPLGNDPTNFQHVAFSIYTTLCEVDSIARNALACTEKDGDVTELDRIEYALSETFTEQEDWEEARYFALEALAALRARLLKAAASGETQFARFYDAVDKAEKVDTNAGDSAVSVVLWSWSENRAALACSGARDCQAAVHLHGCLSDTGRCDEPGEHVV